METNTGKITLEEIDNEIKKTSNGKEEKSIRDSKIKNLNTLKSIVIEERNAWKRHQTN